MKETNGRCETTVFMSQAGGIVGLMTFAGPDTTKILERLSTFPQTTHDHPVGYEAELATYDTIPITVATPEEREDRNIVLTDCLEQKGKLLKALSDLDFLSGPNAPTELIKLVEQYRSTLNALMAHGHQSGKRED